MFDITNKGSFEKMKILIEELKKNLPDIKMIILENKIDLEDEREVSRELIEEYQNSTNIEIIKTSSKTGEGIEEAFIALVKELFYDKKLGLVTDDEDEQSTINKTNSFRLSQKTVNKRRRRCNC
jgi:GTPase SAR1 family protein